MRSIVRPEERMDVTNLENDADHDDDDDDDGCYER